MHKKFLAALLSLLLPVTAAAGESPRVKDLKRSVAAESAVLTKSQFQTPAVAVNDTYFSIPINHPSVQFWLKYYQNRWNRIKIIYSLSRLSVFLPMIKKEIKRLGLPEDLAYLPLIESKGNPAAVSRAGAAGLWQLMPKTARLFGLRVNWFIDERFDVGKSTKAALEYLKYLHSLLGRWDLAIAAYNAGPGVILRLTKRYKTKDFWKLAKVPDETLNYVPKFLAVLSLIKSGKLKVPNPPDRLISVKVLSTVRLYEVSKKLGVPYYVLKLYNPQYKRRVVPKGHYVYIPAGKIKRFAMLRKSGLIYVYSPKKTESLKLIAKRFGVKPEILKSLNRIRGRYVYRGQVIVIAVEGKLRERAF